MDTPASYQDLVAHIGRLQRHAALFRAIAEDKTTQDRVFVAVRQLRLALTHLDAHAVQSATIAVSEATSLLQDIDRQLRADGQIDLTAFMKGVHTV